MAFLIGLKLCKNWGKSIRRFMVFGGGGGYNEGKGGLKRG